MSKTTKPQTNQAEETKAEKPKFIFSQYQEGNECADTSDITRFFAEGFDPSPWHFALIRFDAGPKAVARYFQKVHKDTHSDWFKADAFDPNHGTIGMGAEYLHPSHGGVNELELWVRPKEADDAEQQQMSAASSRRLEDSDEIVAMRQKVNNQIGTELLGGIRVGRSGW